MCNYRDSVPEWSTWNLNSAQLLFYTIIKIHKPSNITVLHASIGWNH